MELTADSQCETFTLKDIVVTYRPVRLLSHVFDEIINTPAVPEQLYRPVAA